MNEPLDAPQSKRLGEFEILHEIGRGGMGIVHAAVDSKLDRKVAIKVLPESFTADHDRLDRFRREARSLASLNHAGIAAIYSLNEADGIHFLVLELVEGETLQERIARGPLEVKEALQTASQIAAAVEEAHASGIIHRDLKPGNIKFTSKGHVKILDFGLAKCCQSQSMASDPAYSPTLTHEGIVLGTAAYMSPEQARGKTVDKRTDVWSFGCVLFEMLAGKRAFEGDSMADTLAAVITDEPDWQLLREGVPSGVRRLLRRLLEKDSSRRLRDVGDAKLEIDEAISELETGSVASGDEDRVLRERSTSTRTPARLKIVLPDSATYSKMSLGLWRTGMAIAPDGTKIAYVGRGPRGNQLFLRFLDSWHPTPIPSTEDAISPAFSPNSDRISFFADSCLKVVSASTQEPPKAI